MEVEDGIEVPESPLLRLEPKNRYGSVPGLEDEELADPEELERCVRFCPEPAVAWATISHEGEPRHGRRP